MILYDILGDNNQSRVTVTFIPVVLDPLSIIVI